MQRVTLGKSGSEAASQLQGRIARAFSSNNFVNTMGMTAAIKYSTIPRAVQLKTIVLYCRQYARFLVHTSPSRKFSECASRFLIRPVSYIAR